MQIYFLGTGTSQGIPVIGSQHPVCLSNDQKDKRLRVSVWIKTENASIIIDCGPDFRQQMLKSKCQHIDGLLFTHEHADHTAGLDDIRPFYFVQGNINVFAHERVIKNLEKRFDYIFQTENKYPGAPSVNAQILKNEETFFINNEAVIPVNSFHGNLQVFGFRIRNFAYLTDVKTIEDSELEKLLNLDVLVVNALKFENHPTHFNVEDALSFIAKLKPKKAYLTHISHLMGFHNEVEKQLPDNVFLAYDDLVLELRN
jgi:phosphoribosyl 1,2-cyclic phosphate phosphodiesterase